jgi:hypothetical protein
MAVVENVAVVVMAGSGESIQIYFLLEKKDLRVG